jgi:predicted dehydrogenase
MTNLKVGIAGYGVVGKRRHFFIDTHPNLKVTSVCDYLFEDNFMNENGINCFNSYLDLIEGDIDILFVCLPNNIAPLVTIAGLKKGLHVFCEKPPGRTTQDIIDVIEIEKTTPNLKLKYGFNHRYHDSVKLALKIINSGNLGDVINIRGVYGKSKIIDFSGGWRSEREIAGGGILLDQGIHMLDLMRLFCDEFIEIKSFVNNSYWKHDVEDNAYAIMKDQQGRIAMIHSTATQWQHRFMLDIGLTKGYIELHGILSGSKSYGEEKIVYGSREEDLFNGLIENKTVTFLNDNSWKEEIYEFANSIINNEKINHGTSNDALQTMILVNQIYYNDLEWRNKYKISNNNN